MKALEEALAAPDLATQLEILRTIPPKDYKKLLKAVEIERNTLDEKFPLHWKMPDDEIRKNRQAREPMSNFRTLAILVAYHKRKKFPRNTWGFLNYSRTPSSTRWEAGNGRKQCTAFVLFLKNPVHLLRI